ncbi:MAG: TIGR02186 family protein, partial [Alphaproteobacteria bacterium]|nr:TIGR02186 family protein [Alphaproteobacteria bacterium]
MKTRFALIIAALLAACSPAWGEDLVSGLSQDVIQITSNYTGTDIVVFGAIENRSVLAPNPADIVVLVRGPDVDMTVRKKERVAGIWLNNHGVVMEGVPAFYFLASTRPLNEIASKAT